MTTTPLEDDVIAVARIIDPVWFTTACQNPLCLCQVWRNAAIEKARSALTVLQSRGWGRIGEETVLTALLWAWTNALGRMPDANTMTDAEIQKYHEDYESLLKRAVQSLTGLDPDAYLAMRNREPRASAPPHPGGKRE